MLPSSPTGVPATPAFPDATDTNRGVVNLSTQIFHGKKIFDGGIETQFLDAGIVQGLQVVSTSALDGGPWNGNFSCPNNPAATTPCLVNPNTSLEIAGACYQGNCSSSSASIYIANIGLKLTGPVLRVINQYGGLETMLEQVDGNGDVRAGVLNGDFYTGPGGHFYCSNANTCYIYGAGGGSNPTLFIVPAIAQTSGNVVTVFADPNGSAIFTIDVSGAPLTVSSKTHGVLVLNGSGASSVTVRSGAVCTCTDQTSGDKVICPVSGTTANFSLGVAGHSVSYVCI